MKYLTLLILSFLFVNAKSVEGLRNASDTCKSTFDTLTNQIVYSNVDVLPQFPGGEKELLIFLADNVEYPEQEVFQGSFLVEFVVDSQGNVSGQRIGNIKNSELTSAEKEILRVIGTSPKWRPGKCNDKNVPVFIQLPVRL